MRKPIKEIEIEGDDKAHTIMQVAQRLPPQYLLPAVIGQVPKLLASPTFPFLFFF